MRPRSRDIQAGLGLLLLLGLGIFAAGGYLRLTGLECGDEERAVYEEFPQYGGRRIEAEDNLGFGTCFASYETPASREEIQEYYAGKLRRNGWRVTREPSPAELAPPERTAVVEPVPGEPGKTREVPLADAGDLIVAERDGFYYEVSYQSLQDYIKPRRGLDVIVHVGEE